LVCSSFSRELLAAMEGDLRRRRCERRQNRGRHEIEACSAVNTAAPAPVAGRVPSRTWRVALAAVAVVSAGTLLESLSGAGVSMWSSEAFASAALTPRIAAGGLPLAVGRRLGDVVAVPGAAAAAPRGFRVRRRLQEGYATMLRDAAGAGKIDIQRAEKALKRLQGSSNSVGVQAYHRVLEVCALKGDVAKAAELYNQMEKKGLQPMIRTFEILLEACAAGGNPEAADGFLTDMVLKDLTPTNAMYGMVLSAAAKVRDFGIANKWYVEAKKAEISLKPEPIFALVQAAVDSGDKVGKKRWQERAKAAEEMALLEPEEEEDQLEADMDAKERAKWWADDNQRLERIWEFGTLSVNKKMLPGKPKKLKVPVPNFPQSNRKVVGKR